jgi:hypothetical protein
VHFDGRIWDAVRGRLAQAQPVAQAPLLAPQCPALTRSEVVIETRSGTVLRQRHDRGRPASELSPLAGMLARQTYGDWH